MSRIVAQGLGGIPVSFRTLSNQSAKRSNGTDTGSTARSAHKLTSPVGWIRVVYCNGSDVYGDTPAIPILVTASYENPLGGTNTHPIYFDGQRQVTIEPGGMVVSDPVNIGYHPAGDTIYIRTFVSTEGGATASGAWPTNLSLASAQSEGASNTATGVAPNDLTLTGAITAASGLAFAPVTVIGGVEGTPGASVAGFGDSIMSASNTDTGVNSDYYIVGFLARALSTNFAFINLGLAGDTLGNALVGKAKDKRVQLAAMYSNVCVEHGTNEIMASTTTTAATQQNMVNAWRMFNGQGSRVFQTTCPPRTSSTDGWATTANQTPVTTNPNAGEPGRQTINAWLRAGAPIDPNTLAPVAVGTAGALLAGADGHPLYAVWDTAATIESTPGGVPGAGGSVWLIGSGTADGVHPGKAGHALMAGAVNTAQLATG